MDAEFWIVLTVPAIIAIIWFVKVMLPATINRALDHKLNIELEKIRFELHRSEESFKSELRRKEDQLAALRDGVLGGRAKRQELVDKRRIQAVECIWTAIQDLSPYKTVAAQMSVINLDSLNKSGRFDNEKLTTFFKSLVNAVKTPEIYVDPARSERLFVSESAWAYYSAYKIVVHSSYGHAKMLSIGIDDASSVLDKGKIREILKVALPDLVQYIEMYDTNTMYNLLDTIEARILNDLRKTLRGEEIEESDIARSTMIMKLVNEATQAEAKKGTEVAPAIAALSAGSGQ